MKAFVATLLLFLSLSAEAAPTCAVRARVMEFRGRTAGHRTFRVRLDDLRELTPGGCAFARAGGSLDVGTNLPGLRAGDEVSAGLEVGRDPGLSAIVTNIRWSGLRIEGRPAEEVPELERQAESQTFFY